MKQLFALVIGIVFTYHCQAQNKPVVVADNQSLLWRISGGQMHKPSYLFGTIHLICPEDYIWTPKMKQALQQSDAVCFEMKMDDPNLMMQIAAGMIDNSGKQLKDYFTVDEYKKIEQYVKDSLSMDMAMLQQAKPIALETMLSMKAGICNDPISYEENILRDAQKNHMPVMGLEEADEQIAVLETIPTDSIVKEILLTLSGNNDDKAEYRRLVNAYKKQDLPALYLLLKDAKSIDDNMNVFLDDRNEKWIERMVDKMEQHSIFFAVGAGHLWGDKGVITLLRNAGYTVTAVK